MRNPCALGELNEEMHPLQERANQIATFDGNSPRIRLLLIEDDPMIGRAVERGLRSAGYAVDWETDGQRGLAAATHGGYELIVLDLRLPSIDGLSLLQILRSLRNDVPVLITSSRDTVFDRIAGLDTGADDYLLKPFDLAELIARVRSLLRRHVASASTLLVAGSLTLDATRRRVTRDGKEVSLTAKEFALVEALMRRPGTVLSRERLEESIYAWGEEIGSNAVEVHLHKIRRKLGADVIRNVRGVGYRIAA